MMHSCHLCGSGPLEVLAALADSQRVTSDCKPWRSGARLAFCPACGGVQKILDDAWHRDAAEIYAHYELYYQAQGGAEQPVFDSASGTPAPRSLRILEHFRSRARLPETGRLLDLGSGTGAVLRSASRLLPDWRLHAFEPHSRDRAALLRIPGVEQLHESALAEIDDRFDAMTSIHMLEHVENPLPFLTALRPLLQPEGHLLVQVPFFPDNPFDLMVADHCSHFTAERLGCLLAEAGFDLLEMSTGIVAKELTAICRAAPEPAAGGGTSRPRAGIEADRHRLEAGASWLIDVRDAACAAAADHPIGLFGTAIAANWLLAELGDRVAFFVDEDSARWGSEIAGRPVLRPQAVPANATVFLGLSPAVADAIARRIRRPDLRLIVPPPTHPA